MDAIQLIEHCAKHGNPQQNIECLQSILYAIFCSESILSDPTPRMGEIVKMIVMPFLVDQTDALMVLKECAKEVKIK